MMEVASLLRLSRSSFYRAVKIFQRAEDADPRIALVKQATAFACASLEISAKMDSAKINYL